MTRLDQGGVRIFPWCITENTEGPFWESTIPAMQINSTERSHLSAFRMTFITKSNRKKCWRRRGKKLTLPSWWWEGKLLTATLEDSLELPKHRKSRATEDPEVPRWGRYPGKASNRRTHAPQYLVQPSFQERRLASKLTVLGKRNG